jgi:hypothetical protein
LIRHYAIAIIDITPLFRLLTLTLIISLILIIDIAITPWRAAARQAGAARAARAKRAK